MTMLTFNIFKYTILVGEFMLYLLVYVNNIELSFMNIFNIATELGLIINQNKVFFIFTNRCSVNAPYVQNYGCVKRNIIKIKKALFI